MAFVFRSEIKGTYIPKSDVIGPGQYDYKIDQDLKPYNHPFNSTVQRQQKSNEFAPGPGTYNLQSSFDCQKIIFQSDEQEIKILEVPKPISVFRSTTLRFKEDKTDFPGPTQYFQEERRQYNSAGQPKRQRKLQILEQMIKNNKYTSIPSIPSNIHQGYTENKDNQLEQNPIDLTYDIGPGSYDLQSTFGKVRGVSWHQSKEKKEVKSSLGPGYYDVTSQSQPMYQMKPTTAFSSKLNRYSDLRSTNQKTNTGYIKKGLDKKNYSFNLSTNAGTTARDTDDDGSEYSYIEDATPGPGYYDSTQQSISQVLNKSKIKGTLKTRTKRFHTNSQHTPGPGSYQLEVIAQRHQGPKPPFLGGTNRFEQQISETPAPGTYKAKNTMEDKMINRLLKAPLGQFGVNEQRFRDTKTQIPGPGSYDKIDEEKKNLESKGSPSFLSHVPKIQDLTIPNLNPAPGSYNVIHHTIAHKIIKPEEDDPKLAVIKPPFGVGAERWKIQEPITEVDDEDAYIHERSPKQDFIKKRKKDPPAFMCKEDRFSKSVPKSNLPGPAEYADGMYPNWNRRTFNIIFAEI